MMNIETIGDGGSRSLALIILIVCLLQIAMLFLTVWLTRFLVSVGERLSLARRIQRGVTRSRSVARHELRFAAWNAGFGTLLLGFTGYLYARGTIVVHLKSAGVVTVMLECAAYIAGLDGYSYLVHRLMHTRFLFRNVDYVHHRSTTPNALSSISFHPVEWIVLGLYFPLALWILRPHLASVVLLGASQLFLTSFSHCGYEYAPSWWYTNPISSCFQTPFFHDVHHQTSKHNFGGVVSTLWDRLFGTVSPTFERQFVELMKGVVARESRAREPEGFGVGRGIIEEPPPHLGVVD